LIDNVNGIPDHVLESDERIFRLCCSSTVFRSSRTLAKVMLPVAARYHVIAPDLSRLRPHRRHPA